jgi:hypothetical protein
MAPTHDITVGSADGRAIVSVWLLGYSQTRASSVSQVSPAGLTTQVGFIRIRTRVNPSSVVPSSFTIAYARQMDARVKPAHDDLWGRRVRNGRQLQPSRCSCREIAAMRSRAERDSGTAFSLS